MTLSDLKVVLLSVWKEMNPRTIKGLVGTASFLWAFALLIGPQTFERQAWVFVQVVSPESVWAMAFLLHTVGVIWCLTRIVRIWWMSLLVNTYGFLLWFFTTLASNLAVGAFSPGSAMEWTMIFAQGYVILVTGTRKDLVKL